MTGRCVGTRGVADRKASLPGRAHRCLGWMCKHPGMDMTLRFEIFPQDLNVIVDFYGSSGSALPKISVAIRTRTLH